MFRILRVSGDSLAPAYQEGDFVIVSKIPYFCRQPRDGDVVAFRHAEYGTLIKRVDGKRSRDGELFVVGTHGFSVDSRRFGTVPQRDILGKVIWHIKQTAS